MTWPLWLQRLGGPGVVGIACLLAVGWVEFAWLPEQDAQVQRTESDGRRLRHTLQARADALQAAASASSEASQRIDPRAGPRQAWATLWQALPDASQRLALQRAVLGAAKDAGVPLTSVQMRGELAPWIDATQPQGLWRQRMVMPVQASYPALRTWLDSLLRQPALSIDAIDIQRSDPMSDQVKAQVSVSLWWRQDRSH